MVINAEIRVSEERIKNFCKQYQVQRLALFGSVLRNDFRPDSDIDILVVFGPSARGVTFMTLGKMRRELSDMFQRPVDLVLQEGLKQAIKDAVISSAEEIYAA
jgi:uncharacterized protein